MSSLPVLLSLLAGLSTAFGAFLVRKSFAVKLKPISLAFATGVMLMIALSELIPESLEYMGIVKTLILSGCGVALSLILDLLFPHHHEHDEHEHEVAGHFLEECECSHHDSVALSMVLALILHNVIEGIATGLTLVDNLSLGINMVIGIMLHNIPIGTTLAVSFLSAGKTKANSVLYTAGVGLTQTLGALIGLIIAQRTLSFNILPFAMALVSGTLLFISFDELWPASSGCKSRLVRIAALVIGICFVPLSELLIG